MRLAQQQDRRLADLRAFALQYVKQIVAKAAELSQERQEACPGAPEPGDSCDGGADQRLCGGAPQLPQRAAIPTTCERGQLRAAAAQINRRFHLEAARGRPAQAASGGVVDELGEGPEEAGGGKARNRRRFFQTRLNWHLLVSCFSTCLPNAMSASDSMPSRAN